MKKKIITIQLLFFLGICANAQLGVRGFDKETHAMLNNGGDLRIRKLENKFADKSYDRFLVISKEGNVNYTSIDKLRPDNYPLPKQRNVVNNYYPTDGNIPIDTQISTCGKFQFAFVKSGSNVNIQFRLKDAPDENILIYTTFERFNADNDSQFQAANEPRILTPINNFVDLNIGTTEQPTLNQIQDGEYNELYISFPKNPEFYRASFYRVNQNDLTRWITTCEKF